MTQKTRKKRTIVVYQINQGTKPEDAAQRIKDKFGKDFAKELKNNL